MAGITTPISTVDDSTSTNTTAPSTTLWWKTGCSNRSIYDAFWDTDLTINTPHPDFTNCLQQTLLVWGTYGAFLVTGFCYLIYLTTQIDVSKAGHSRWHHRLKMLVGTLLLVTVCVEFFWDIYIDWSSGDMFITLVDYAAYIFRIFAVLLLMVVMRSEFNKGVASSSIVFFFLFFTTIMEAFRVASADYRYKNQDAYVMFHNWTLRILYFTWLMTLLVLHFRPDHSALPWDRYSDDTTASKLERLPLVKPTGKAPPPYSSGSSVGFAGSSSSTKRPFVSEPDPSPVLYAPAWSRFTFMWMFKHMWRGWRRPIMFQDVPDVMPIDKVDSLLPDFNRHYYTGEPDAAGRRPHRGLGRALVMSQISLFVMAVWYRMLSMVLVLINPQVLGFLITYLESENVYMWQGLVLAFTIFCNSSVASLMTNQLLHTGFMAGMRSRSIVNAAVYRKALRLSSTSRRDTTSGQVVNLMSVDAQKVQDMMQSATMVWSAPITIGLCVYLLFDTVGVAAVSGMVVILVLFPINVLYLARKSAKLQRGQMMQKDKRFRCMNEILTGIKVLKFYAWEKSFLNRIVRYRENELVKIKWANYISAFSSTCWFLSPYLVSLAIFVTYGLIDNRHVLTADMAFVTLSYINLLNIPISILPQGVASMAQGFISLRRLQQFMDLDELEEDKTMRGSAIEDVAIKLEDCTYSWSKTMPPILKDIRMEIPRQKLVAIVGQVGCGKSSLINALLGELHSTRGQAELNGTVAYVPQQAWILNTTVKDNILFQKDLDSDRYTSICEACALTPDLAILPGGDLTEIGEKGINLSGGQKQRVSLARAVYQNEDIYLLDDPLSAVDAHVGKHIFEKVIGPEGLLRYRTRILVTHGATYLPHVDYIYVMAEGHISEHGTFRELVDKGGDFAEFLRKFVLEQDPTSADEAEEILQMINVISGGESVDEEGGSKSDRSLHKSLLRSKERLRSKSLSLKKSGIVSVSLEEKPKPPKPLEQGKLIREEMSQVGKLKPRVLKAYVMAAGWFLALGVVLAIVCFVGFQITTNLWLSAWTSDPRDQDPQENLENAKYRMIIYGLLGLGQVLFSMIASFCLATGCYFAARAFHHHLIERVLHAPMSYFDTTPLGRIMNRFSKDLDVVDMNMPITLRMFVTAICPVATTFITIAYVFPWFLLLFIPIAFLFVFFKNFFLATGRQLKRIDAVRRSPIFSTFDETVAGATSIRAYGKQEFFVNKCDRLINESQRPWFMFFSSQRWFGVNMEVVSNTVVIMVALFCVLYSGVDPSLAGLTLSYAMTIAVYMNQVIRSSTELETFVVSVERLQEYDDLEQEAEWILPHKRPPSSWPDGGTIHFWDYSTRYRPGLELVLKNVNFEIRGGEKVGIVGRTGAGKSSLSLGLFRIIEPASGSIVIDNRDVTQMGLHDIRGKISIIPQDPVIFSGSLRSNLDPFDQYGEQEIWSALADAHLKEYVSNQPEGLNYECGENGEALSVGQRQLVCLARALLRNSKILVLDEATAAVDLETDSLIQTTIRTRFENCTILTVAHRISTVMDYDKIMVLDKGEMVEFDAPENLMRNAKSAFSRMAKDAGLL